MGIGGKKIDQMLLKHLRCPGRYNISLPWNDVGIISLDEAAHFLKAVYLRHIKACLLRMGYYRDIAGITYLINAV